MLTDERPALEGGRGGGEWAQAHNGSSRPSGDRSFSYLEDCGGVSQDPWMTQQRIRKCMFVTLEFHPICRWWLELVLLNLEK